MDFSILLQSLSSIVVSFLTIGWVFYEYLSSHVDVAYFDKDARRVLDDSKNLKPQLV